MFTHHRTNFAKNVHTNKRNITDDVVVLLRLLHDDIYAKLGDHENLSYNHADEKNVNQTTATKWIAIEL